MARNRTSNWNLYDLLGTADGVWQSDCEVDSSTDMATDDMKARLSTAFNERLLTRLDDENFQLALPNHVLYLQDDVDGQDDEPNEIGRAHV